MCLDNEDIHRTANKFIPLEIKKTMNVKANEDQC